MEESKIVSPQIKGVMIALVVIILGIAGYYSGIAFNGWYNWVVNCVLLIALVIACIHFANQKQGYVTFGKVFMHGFVASMVVALILLVYTIIAFTVLFPDMQDKIFEMQVEQLEKRGMDSDKIEEGMKIAKRFFWPITIAATIFGTLIWGAISSLIGAALAKKNKVNPIEQFPQ